MHHIATRSRVFFDALDCFAGARNDAVDPVSSPHHCIVS
jgi:hypothetical protein